MTVDAQPPTWLHLACRRSVVRRAVKYAIFVGALLTLINHGDALLRGDITAGRLARILLTFAVPYCVATFASVSTAREAQALRAKVNGVINVDREHLSQ
jgi:hypothetical protein